MAVFGLPFLGAGLSVMLIGAGVVPIQNYQNVPWFMVPALLFMGLVFTLVGGALVFGRSWTTLSSADRTVVMQMGLLAPMSTKTYRVDDYNGVILEFIRGDSDSSDQFPVSLKARAGSNLRLFSSTEYADARERATAVAELFHFEIEDSSTGRQVRFSAAQADMSFQHRQRIEHQRDEIIVQPVSMRSKVSESNGVVTIVIPAARVHPALYLFFLIPVAAPVLLFEPFFRFFRQSQTPDIVAWIFLGFLVIAFGVLPAYTALKAFLTSRLGRTTIAASTAGVRIEERRVWKTRTLASLAAHDILDVDYPPPNASSRDTAADQAGRPSMAAPPVGEGLSVPSDSCGGSEEWRRCDQDTARFDDVRGGAGRSRDPVSALRSEPRARAVTQYRLWTCPLPSSRCCSSWTRSETSAVPVDPQDGSGEAAALRADARDSVRGTACCSCSSSSATIFCGSCASSRKHSASRVASCCS